jgi:hypothetical protein
MRRTRTGSERAGWKLHAGSGEATNNRRAAAIRAEGDKMREKTRQAILAERRTRAVMRDCDQSEAYRLAIEAGVADRSYRTHHFGLVYNFVGKANIRLADGTRWTARGYGPRGDAENVRRHGGIEFSRV